MLQTGGRTRSNQPRVGQHSSRTPGDFSESDEPVDLWAGTKPVLSDLTRMLEVNPHFQRLASKWTPEMLTVEIAASHYFCSTVLNRKESGNSGEPAK